MWPELWPHHLLSFPRPSLLEALTEELLHIGLCFQGAMISCLFSWASSSSFLGTQLGSIKNLSPFVHVPEPRVPHH
jgi:hypothetical protein